MKIISITLMFIFLLTNALYANATGLLIVANIESTELDLQKRQVRDVFMGTNSSLDLVPVALSPDQEPRYFFNTKIIGLTEARIQSFWAQMRFSGRNKPPKEFDSIEATLEYVVANKNTVTYVPDTVELPAGLTVLYRTN